MLPERFRAIDVGAGERLGLGFVAHPDHDDVQTGNLVAQDARRVDHLAVALLPHQPADDAAHERVVVDVPTPAQRRARRRRRRRGIERARSMPLPSRWSFSARNAEPLEHRDVLDVLDELGLRALGRDPLEPVHDRAAGPAVVGLRVETVHGVDHHGHAGEPRREPSVDTGLRVVRVHDVGPQPREHARQLAERGEIAERGHRPGRVAQRHVPNPERVEPFDVRTGRRHADHFVARVAKGGELRPEQQREADVGRRHVNDTGPSGHVLAPM